jgi:hypothetical protein
MHGGTPGGTSSVQGHVPQTLTRMDNWNASLYEGPDNERVSGNTYPFGCAVEVKGVRGNDDSSIVEKCRIYKWARVIEFSSLMQMSFLTVKN